MRPLKLSPNYSVKVNNLKAVWGYEKSKHKIKKKATCLILMQAAK